ncbi:MAG: HAD hydrolase-like protein [Acidimicrobiales bacterium]
MAITTVLFDLDGTLINSSPGIRRCVDESLAHHGFSAITDEQFSSFIGPPLTTGFGFVGSDETLIESLIGVYREHYGAGGMYEYSVYDGIPELLTCLNDAGFRLAVATSKRTGFARPVVEHAGLASQFEIVVGSERDGAGAEKPVVMRSVFEQLAIADPSTVVMIGDREHDGYGAAATGTDFIGVLWGFGSHGELQAAGARELVAHPSEIGGLLTPHS